MTTRQLFTSIKSTFYCASLAALSLASLSSAQATDTSKLTNKEKAVALIHSIESGDQIPASYINSEKYIQHNLAVADGLAGFGEVLQQLPKGSAKAKVVRSMQDGDYVILHTEYNFFGPKAGFDIFRFENGLIVEHWDNLQKIAPENGSGRTQFDGQTQISDTNRTEENKTIVSEFVANILIGGDMTKIAQFIGPKDTDYLQHNPNVTDGLTGLGAALTALADQGMPMTYSKNHIVLGEGNFVLAVSEGTFLNEHVAYYDLFRLSNGKIVEHWDTIETIPAKSEWKNENGKFGF
ncbi:nuclear transport factor 2 family protein [Arenicella sp. 4NH20-0111]|uniref:nuclear transport factor 2 family protein n=1 Tax=Arenicella sp. 4NH20-0111 TaxID=3127648 RepID=UPI00310617CF